MYTSILKNLVPSSFKGLFNNGIIIWSLQSTFTYHSSYWSNQSPYNLAGGATGLDNQETKLPSYWAMPFTKLCLGMKVGADTRFILVHRQASSLFSLIASGSHHGTSLGRDQWKSLIAGSSLQWHCGRQGFNSDSAGQKVRIGIIGNEQHDCSSPDSFVGYGSGVSWCSCGNYAGCCGADNGNDRHTPALGYIFIQW